MRTLICSHPSSEANKDLLASAYDYYVKFLGQTWEKPEFTREGKPFFLPLETELDTLISRARPKMATFLLLLKETGADSGEAWKLRWIDIDSERKTVNITPTKNHLSRTLPISTKLLTRLLALPRKTQQVFPNKNFESFRRMYDKMKIKLARDSQNPRIKEVAFRSFRHWKGTMLYHQTKDILYVKYFLGHRRIENTLVYTHLLKLEDDEYVCKTAQTLEEATQLIEAGI